ncbi:MAG TPA: type II toxin-antitoxin system VapC family toxin [Pseudolabrys sp.]|nr:type II toxin-antitoxin system VapC family toxin [Pseudolabrys sp.]
MIVLDASLIIALILREANVPDGDSVYNALEAEALTVPAHWAAEIASALWINRRRDRISANEVAAAVERLLVFGPTVDPAPLLGDIPDLLRFAAGEKLTAYDAIYVQLALRLDAVLATVDEAMRASARRHDIALLPI